MRGNGSEQETEEKRESINGRITLRVSQCRDLKWQAYDIYTTSQ